MKKKEFESNWKILCSRWNENWREYELAIRWYCIGTVRYYRYSSGSKSIGTNFYDTIRTNTIKYLRTREVNDHLNDWLMHAWSSVLDKWLGTADHFSCSESKGNWGIGPRYRGAGLGARAGIDGSRQYGCCPDPGTRSDGRQLGPGRELSSRTEPELGGWGQIGAKSDPPGTGIDCWGSALYNWPEIDA